MLAGEGGAGGMELEGGAGDVVGSGTGGGGPNSEIEACGVSVFDATELEDNEVALETGSLST